LAQAILIRPSLKSVAKAISLEWLWAMAQRDTQITEFLDLNVKRFGGESAIGSNIGRIRGKGGRTLLRIENATGCKIDLKSGAQPRHVPISGTKEQVRLASTIIRCLISSDFNGEVTVDLSDTAEKCTVLQIPKRTTRMVLGKGGEHILGIQHDAHTVMFVARIPQQESDDVNDNVVIFGDRYGRRLSQLLVMALVDSIEGDYFKEGGYFREIWERTGSTFDCPSDCDGDWSTNVLDLQEAAMMLRQQVEEATRDKLMRASGCIIIPVGSLVFVSGLHRQRQYAIDYLDLVLAARCRSNYVSQIRIVEDDDLRPEDRDDCTQVYMPDDCFAMVVGKNWDTAHRIEHQCGVLVLNLSNMRTADETSCGILAAHRPAADLSNLGIFGPSRSRCSAELEIQALVEYFRPGFFTENMDKKICSLPGFGRDYLTFPSNEALLIRGNQKDVHGGYVMETKLSRASSAIVKFVGAVCIIAGTMDERHRCRNYIEWHAASLNDSLCINAAGRADITEVAIHKDSSPPRHNVLRDAEADSGTLIIMAKNRKGEHCLFICGHEQESRAKAAHLVTRLLPECAALRCSSSGGHDSTRSDLEYVKQRDSDNEDWYAKRWKSDGEDWYAKQWKSDDKDWNQWRHNAASDSSWDHGRPAFDQQWNRDRTGSSQDVTRSSTDGRERSRSPPRHLPRRHQQGRPDQSRSAVGQRSDDPPISGNGYGASTLRGAHTRDRPPPRPPPRPPSRSDLPPQPPRPRHSSSSHGNKGSPGHKATDGTIFVGSLPAVPDENSIRSYFSNFGEIQQLNMKYDENGSSRGFCFIVFAATESAQAVFDNYNENMIDGKWVDCKPCDRPIWRRQNDAW